MFKPITGYENYSVDETGVVINNRTGRELKQGINCRRNGGYKVVSLYNASGKKFFFVHRLVAMAFIPNSKGLPQVNHKDENPRNNSAENLEWCDAKYNNSYGTKPARASARRGVLGTYFGRKHSAEAKARMSAAKLGKPSSHRRAVVVDGNRVFESITACAEGLGLSLTQVSNIIHHRRKSKYCIEFLQEAQTCMNV